MDWTNCCSKSKVIVVSLTETGGQSATRTCTGVFITNAVTVIIHTLVLVLVLIYPQGESMHSCVAVHAVLSTSADVCVVMEHTGRVCDWTNCCRDGVGIVVSCTEAGGQSATRACTGVHISTTVTVIPALVWVLVLVLILPEAKVMYCCVAVHAVPSTSADVCVIIKLTSISWSNYC